VLFALPVVILALHHFKELAERTCGASVIEPSDRLPQYLDWAAVLQSEGSQDSAISSNCLNCGASLAGVEEQFSRSSILEARHRAEISLARMLEAERVRLAPIGQKLARCARRRH
jgi:hypothetical protein